ncbi:MAG: hypothetical protein GDA48_14560 [Hormoscilla sp. GM102CHS1]|nr:hypothetical protein [Hormoscilla sp. GM102CHS1]
MKIYFIFPNHDLGYRSSNNHRRWTVDRSFFPSSEAIGHNLHDPMWPWDGALSMPVNLGEGDFPPLLPSFSENDAVTPFDTLDFRELGYTYDTLIEDHEDKDEPDRVLGSRRDDIIAAILSIEGGSDLAIFLGLQATDLANADFTFV